MGKGARHDQRASIHSVIKRTSDCAGTPRNSLNLTAQARLTVRGSQQDRFRHRVGMRAQVPRRCALRSPGPCRHVAPCDVVGVP